jgi:hypothetical protein
VGAETEPDPMGWLWINETRECWRIDAFDRAIVPGSRASFIYLIAQQRRYPSRLPRGRTHIAYRAADWRKKAMTPGKGDPA